jgi:streptogramin lyase
MKPVAYLCFFALGLLQAEAQKPSKKGATLAPPAAGIKTPGIQIPFINLKSEAEIPVPGLPNSMFFADMAFLPNGPENGITRLDTKANKLNDPWAGLKAPCGGLVNAFRSYWVPNCGDQTLVRVDPRSGKVTATIGTGTGSAVRAVAANPDSVWLLSDDKTTLSRIDPEQNAVVSELRLPAKCNSVQFAEAALWVTCPAEGRVLRIEPKTNLVTQRIEVAEPVAQAFGEGTVWVLSRKEGKVMRIDPKTNKVSTTIETGIPNAEGSLAFGEGSVWLSAPGFPITRINPATDKVTQQFAGVGHGDLYTGATAVWLFDQNKKLLKRFDPKRIAATLPE